MAESTTVHGRESQRLLAEQIAILTATSGDSAAQAREVGESLRLQVDELEQAATRLAEQIGGSASILNDHAVDLGRRTEHTEARTQTLEQSLGRQVTALDRVSEALEQRTGFLEGRLADQRRLLNDSAQATAEQVSAAGRELAKRTREVAGLTDQAAARIGDGEESFRRHAAAVTEVADRLGSAKP